MKTVIILIASLIFVTESFAFSKSERNFLLGLSAGAVVAYVLEANNVRGHHSRSDYRNSHKHRKAKRHTRKNHHKHYYGHNKHNKHNKHHRKHANKRRHHYEEVAYNHGHSSHHYRY